MFTIPFSMRRAPRWLHTFVLLALALVSAGCGGSADSSDGGPLDGGPPDAGPATCESGELLLDDGGCTTAGLPPDMQCPPGELPLDDGGCQPAGVPPEDCGPGFETDGSGGCNAILPAAPCPKGLMAVPGDTECHEVAPCGSGDYGMIPGQEDATTHFVKADYPGNDSDGTHGKPWKHIQEGVDHAQSGAIVAVAAGSYVEDVLIKVKPVQVWGRCPAMVEVVGTGAAAATIDVRDDTASESGIHALAITGPGVGFGTRRASNVVVDHVWIHDTMDRGIYARRLLGPSSIKVSASLIETAKKVGVSLEGSDGTIEATAIRNTQPIEDGTWGEGIYVRVAFSYERARLTLRGSLVEQNHEVGVYIAGSDATLDGTVVRQTQPDSDGIWGRGIQSDYDTEAHERPAVILHSSLVEQNHEYGVVAIGSDVTIEATVVRTTEKGSSGPRGDGISMVEATADERSTLTLRSSLLDHNHYIGVHVRGSDATIEGTIVRETQPSSDGTPGHGIDIVDGQGQRSNVTLLASLVDQNHEIGVVVECSDATIEGTIVRATQPRSDGTAGRGIEIQCAFATSDPAEVTLIGSLVEQNHEIGVIEECSKMTIEATIVRTNQGRGIEIQCPFGTKNPMVTLLGSLVEDNHEQGVIVFGSIVTVKATVVRGTLPGSDGSFGDGIDVTQAVKASTVDITSSRAENNARAGINYYGSTGALSYVVSTGNPYGLVVEGEPKPQYDSGTNQFLSDDPNHGIYLGGDLAIPETPSKVPPSP